MAHKRIRKLFVRRRPCQFCLNRNSANNYIDYKDESVLIKLVNLQGKILSSRITGTCAKHQRAVSLAIKRARYVGILPYVGPLPKRFDEQCEWEPTQNKSCIACFGCVAHFHIVYTDQ